MTKSIQNRRTPQWLFDMLNQKFGPFRLDAFADKDNALCEKFYTKEDDGCLRPWEDVTFANPPFNDMDGPLKHAAGQAERWGVRSVVLAPVGCSQYWYRNYAIKGTIYVPSKRINYDLPNGEPTRGADRDTIIICFGGKHDNPDWPAGIFQVRELWFGDSSVKVQYRGVSMPTKDGLKSLLKSF